MKTIRIKFDQLFPGFNPEDNWFINLLSERFKVELSENPDFFFFTHSYYGQKDYLKYKCHRIFFGGENIRANWDICDYVLDSDYYPSNARHKRLPLWVTWGTSLLTKKKDTDAFLGKEKFCCMLVSNPKAKERIEFFHQLSKYKKVDSAGRYLNNIGGSVTNKMEFIKDYKFVISFENSSYPGYTTEKLVEPMLVNSIPIYWGNPRVHEDFNTKSFINVTDYRSYEEVIEKIIGLDRNESAFQNVVNEPWFNNNRIPEEFTREKILDFFEFILQDSIKKKPIATFMLKDIKHRYGLLKSNLQFELKKRF